MAGIGPTSSSERTGVGAVQSEDAPVESGGSTKARGTTDNHVEGYQGPPQAGVEHGAHQAGEVVSGQQLAAAHAQWKSDRDTLRSKLEGPIAAIAKQCEAGTLVAGGGVFDSFAGATFSALFDDKAMWATFNRLPKDQIADLIEAKVRQAMPNASPEERAKVAQGIISRLDTQLLYQGATKLRDAAVSKMEHTAADFERLANDPEQLKALLQQLETAERGTPEQKEAAKGLRKAMGLSEKGTLAEQAEGLKERASLIREQADDLHHTVTPDLLYQKVGKYELAAAVAEGMGIKPDSWAGEQMGAVREAGEERERTIRYISMATKLAAIFAAPGGTGIALAALSGGLESGEAWEAVDAARAGEASGLLQRGSIDRARNHAVVTTAAAAVEVLGSAAMKTHGGEHALEAAGEHLHLGAHAAEHVAELGLTAAAVATTEISRRSAEAHAHHEEGK